MKIKRLILFLIIANLLFAHKQTHAIDQYNLAKAGTGLLSLVGSYCIYSISKEINLPRNQSERNTKELNMLKYMRKIFCGCTLSFAAGFTYLMLKK